MKFLQLKIVVDAAKAFLHNGMEVYETPALVAALCMMFMVVAAKIITTMRLSSLKKELNVLEMLRQETLNRLRAFENRFAVANANLSILTKKKLRIIKRREDLKKELEEFVGEESKPQERADSRKVKM